MSVNMPYLLPARDAAIGLMVGKRRSVTERMKLAEKEYSVITAIAHAYNRELRVLDG